MSTKHKTLMYVQDIDDPQDEPTLGEPEQFSEMTTSYFCIKSAVKRMGQKLGPSFAGIELLLMHNGHRIDVIISLPICNEQRQVVFEALYGPVEFSIDTHPAVVQSGLSLSTHGLLAQVSARHRSAMAQHVGPQGDCLAEYYCGATAVRFIFSSFLMANQPEWLDQASDECPAVARFFVSSDISRCEFSSYGPANQKSSDNMALRITVH